MSSDGPTGSPLTDIISSVTSFPEAQNEAEKPVQSLLSTETPKVATESKVDSTMKPVTPTELNTKSEQVAQLSKAQKKKQKNKTHNGTGQVKICLNMIVRDESRNMVQCMNSVIHLIDAVAIVDTGSEDNTIEIINDYCKQRELPEEVISKKWVDDFGHSRTEALRHAEDFLNRLDKNSEWYLLF